MHKKPAEKAVQVLREHSITEAPVDVEDVAERLGIQVNYEDLDSEISGLMLFENGVAKAAINRSHHSNRQRFTLAHEIGHLILHTSGDNAVFVDKRFFRNKASSTGDLLVEVEANAFAAALLMPESFIRSEISDDEGITELDIFRLATKFEVSEQAMTLRLVGLGLIEPDLR